MGLRQRVYPLNRVTTREASNGLTTATHEKLQRTIQLPKTVKTLTMELNAQ